MRWGRSEGGRSKRKHCIPGGRTAGVATEQRYGDLRARPTVRRSTGKRGVTGEHSVYGCTTTIRWIRAVGGKGEGNQGPEARGANGDGIAPGRCAAEIRDSTAREGGSLAPISRNEQMETHGGSMLLLTLSLRENRF